MEQTLISDGELARAAEVAPNTVKRAKKDPSEVRITTRRRLLEGLNVILKKRGQPVVNPEIFR